MVRPVALTAAFLALFVAGLAFGQQTTGGDVKRRSIAITYPNRGKIEVKLTGTTRTPKANGGAQVRRDRGLTRVEIEVDDMVPAYLLGADYTTYVLWAVTPEGQVENMGESGLTEAAASSRRRPGLRHLQ